MHFVRCDSKGCGKTALLDADGPLPSAPAGWLQLHWHEEGQDDSQHPLSAMADLVSAVAPHNVATKYRQVFTQGPQAFRHRAAIVCPSCAKRLELVEPASAAVTETPVGEAGEHIRVWLDANETRLRALAGKFMLVDSEGVVRAQGRTLEELLASVPADQRGTGMITYAPRWLAVS